MSTRSKPSPQHPIQVVARRTGLSLDLLRAWEKRYGAVSPKRTPADRRLYSDQDIERLLLLQRAMRGGHSIGQVARLPIDDLQALVESDATAAQRLALESTHRFKAGGRAAPRRVAKRVDVGQCLSECLDSVRRLDVPGLETDLGRASLALSQPALLEQLLTPLLHRIGEEWSQGSMRIAHEHLAVAVVRTLVGRINSHAAIAPAAPRLVVGTPAGQRHELAALFATVIATAAGWRTVYLGPDLPAEEIAIGAESTGASAVALSITYPPDDPGLPEELRRLRRLLPRSTALLIGGAAAKSYATSLKAIRVKPLPDFVALRTALHELQQPGRS